MKIILTDLEEFGLQGELDLETGPTGREMNRFRKEAQMTPSDLTDAISNGAVEVVQLYLFTALERAGQSLAAGRVLDIPLERLGGIEIETDDETDVEEVAAEKQLPPTPETASPESESVAA